MATTYKAILTGDRVQWLGEAPQTNGGVRVDITVADQISPPEDDAARRAGLAAAMDALVRSGAGKAFGDPVEWQREIRKDKPLVGREDE